MLCGCDCVAAPIIIFIMVIISRFVDGLSSLPSLDDGRSDGAEHVSVPLGLLRVNIGAQILRKADAQNLLAFARNVWLIIR